MSDDPNDNRLDLTQWTEIEEVPDGGILAGVVGEDHVFVWRTGNRLKAYSADCPHLGGPLNKGIVVGATIRCPWHHACFDFETEEATAAPAFDALLEYPVTIDDNRFSAKPASAQIFRRIGRHEVSLGTMAIVGGGAAGFAAADAIRKIGWRGGVTIFSDEAEQPHDRTLLTKDYLEGAFGDDRLPIARHSLLTWASISKATRASNKSSPNTNDCDWRTGTSDPMRSCSSLRAPLHDDLMFREEAYRT
jgi:apoptosis-inducing factor 3